MVTLGELNRLANHPSIMPEIAPGYEWCTLEKLYRHPNTVIVGDSLGVIILTCADNDGIIMWHWLLSPKRRGAKALALGRVALKEVFANPKNRAICGITPRSNRAARLMNRALGARPIGYVKDTAGRDCIHYFLERATWEASFLESLGLAGHC